MFYWFGKHTKLEDPLILLIINVLFLYFIDLYCLFLYFIDLYCLFIYFIVYLFILLINSGFLYPLNSLIGYSLWL